MNDQFHGDLLRNPGPLLSSRVGQGERVTVSRPRRRVIPIGYGLIFGVVFGLTTYVFLINWAIDAIHAFRWVFGS